MEQLSLVSDTSDWEDINIGSASPWDSLLIGKSSFPDWSTPIRIPQVRDALFGQGTPPIRTVFLIRTPVLFESGHQL